MLKAVTIEPLAEPDSVVLHDVALIEALAWGGSSDLGAVDAREQRLTRELEQSDPEAKRILVATKAGIAVGICRVQRNSDDPEAWMVFGIAVHPEHRRQGIGRALFDAAIAFARSHGARTILSETHVRNHTSIAFHQSVGFAAGRPFTEPADGGQKLAYSMTVAE